MLTDCFAFFDNRCTALNTLICSKSSYCQFYKKESENCNRTLIENSVDLYSSPKKRGDIANEKVNTKPNFVQERDNSYQA